MAKMKVHELAKELQKQSKEILAFLQEQGIEAKAPQSIIWRRRCRAGGMCF